MGVDIAAMLKTAGELADADKADEAMELCNKILYHELDNYKALFVAGSVLMKAGRHVQAIQLLKRVTEIVPKDHRGWGQLALCYGEFHRYDESIRYAERALAIRRESKTLADAAYAYINGGEWDRGRLLAQEALSLDPGNADASLHTTNCALAAGEWASGWKGFRQTQRTKFRKEWHYDGTAEWQGEPDAIVAVTGEQGLGDEIMGASVIPDAARACKQFIFDCDSRLAPLFQRSFPNVLVRPSRREKVLQVPQAPTHHKALYGLCELFRTEDSQFPRKAFLRPNEDYRRGFKAMLPNYDPLGLSKKERVIGLAWSGGLPRTGQENRKAGLNAFLPLIRAGGAEFVSLEYKDDAAEVAAFEKQYGLQVRRLPWATQQPDMDLLAGLIAACDEVIGVATTALHLSSAMGVPTTCIANRGLGWQWARPDMPWYPPTTQIWRKRSGESWRESVARLVEDRKG
jgi:Tfp pilus assembly protein PilF